MPVRQAPRKLRPTELGTTKATKYTKAQMKDTPPNTAARRWVHWTTVGIVFVLVVVPWILVAIPGESMIRESMNRNAEQLDHGWPAIHLVSRKTNATRFGNVVAAYESWANQPLTIPDPIMRWGFEGRRFERFRPLWAHSFWTSPNAWPSRHLHEFDSDNVVMKSKLIWSGLAINIAVLLLACLIAGAVCESRIRRRGSLFKFSILDFCLLFVGLSIVFAWVNRCNRDAKAEFDKVRQMTEFKNKFQGVGIKYETKQEALPMVVARLLDYPERLPFVPTWALQPIKVYQMEFYFPQIPADELPALASHVNDLPYPLDLDPGVWSDKHEEFLGNINLDSIASIRLGIAADELHELDGVLNRFASRTSLSVYANISPGEHLDLSPLESLPKIKLEHLNLTFAKDVKDAPFDWQEQAIRNAVAFQGLPYAEINNLDSHGEKVLAQIHANDKTTVLVHSKVGFRNTEKLKKNGFGIRPNFAFGF